MELSVSSPCPMAWDNLVGDDRVRFCAKCRLNVYNIAEMASDDVERLILKNEGRLCGRVYVRDDGTATAENCRENIRRKVKAAIAVATVLLISALFGVLRPHGRMDRSALPPLLRQVVDWINPEPRAVMGKMICPKIPAQNPAPPGPGSSFMEEQ
jgi:hypothetical protein